MNTRNIVTLKRSKRRYEVMPNGMYIRLDRKPWGNKAEHKRHKKERRMEREAA